LFVVDALPFRRVRVRVRVVLVPFGEFVVLLSVAFVVESVALLLLLLFLRRCEAVELDVVESLVLFVLLLAAVGEVGSIGVPADVPPGFAGEFAFPVFDPGAPAVVPVPIEPEVAPVVDCANMALVKVAHAASVISRIAFMEMLFIDASSRECFPLKVRWQAHQKGCRPYKIRAHDIKKTAPVSTFNSDARALPLLQPLGIPLAFSENP
jgi:hypothetical protein